MKTKKDVIQRFQTLKGKQITVVTAPTYIIGVFSPSFDTRIFYLRCSAVQIREVVNVSNRRITTRKIKEMPVGFTSLHDFAIDWFNCFMESLNFHDTTPEIEEDIKRRLKEEYFKDLDSGFLFHKFGFNDLIHCDFPKASDMLIGDNCVSMYGNSFDLTINNY